MDKQKQKSRIIEYCLSHNGITQHEANTLSVSRLPSRIYDLKKDGFVFGEEWETALNQYGEKVRFKRYIFKAFPANRTKEEEAEYNAVFMRAMRRGRA